MILFLDFDGVLHDYDGTAKDLFRHAPRFSAVLRDTRREHRHRRTGGAIDRRWISIEQLAMLTTFL